MLIILFLLLVCYKTKVAKSNRPKPAKKIEVKKSTKNKTYDKYYNYPAEVVLKRVLKYAWKNKFIIILSLVFLIGYTYLELYQPKLINRVLDDHLLGVQTTWVKTSDGDVNYENVTYKKIERDQVQDTDDIISIVYVDNGYYMVDGNYSSSDIKEYNEELQQLVLSDETMIDAIKLDKVALRTFYEPSVSPIVKLLIIYGSLTIVIIIFRYFQHVFFLTASMRLTLNIRIDAFDKLNRLPMNYFVNEPSGKIVTKITSDSEGVRGLYQVIFSILTAVISLLMVYVELFKVNWRLSLLTLLATPLILLWMTVYRKINNKYQHRIREMNSIINAAMAQYVDCMAIIQQFNKEEAMTTEYDGLLTTNYHNKMNALRINSIFGGELLLLIQNGLLALIIYYFGRQFLTHDGAITAGALYLYVTYINKIFDPIREIFANLNSLEDSFVASSRIFDLLDQEEDKYLGFNERPNFKGDIKFEHVNFAYDETPVLKNINIHVKAGQFIGLVGHTGSGKSTMMILLQRFYDLIDGKILIDDIDFMKYTKQEVRSNIGYVLQEPALFSGTIKSNITLGIDATDEEVEKVLEMIGAKKFVEEYPEGINTKLEYLGSNLSTGEKQLISFARILLRNPAILILDEATANIDTETEQLIQHALKVLAAGRTTFVVAHRLSTIRNADNIFVLEDGQIIESGNHDQLYNSNGKYRAMYEAQYGR